MTPQIVLLRVFLPMALASVLVGCGRAEAPGARIVSGESRDAFATSASDSALPQTVPAAPLVEIRTREDTVRVGQSVALSILNRGRGLVYRVPCSDQKQIRRTPTVMARSTDEWAIRAISFCGPWDQDIPRLDRIEPGRNLVVPYGGFDVPGTWRVKLHFLPSPGARYRDTDCCYSNPFEVVP